MQGPLVRAPARTQSGLLAGGIGRRYFHKLQARSALFDEETNAAPAMATGWLYFGIYVLGGLVFAALCGYLAVTRSLSPLPWFFAGLVGNLAALLVLLVTPRGNPVSAPAVVPAGLAKVPVTHAPARCETCGRLNHPSAKECSHCNAPLNPTTPSEVVSLQQAEET